MKRLIVLLLALGVSDGCDMRPPATGGTAATSPSAESTQGNAVVVEEASLTYIQGGQGSFALTRQKGKVMLFDICAPWSPASRALIPELNRLHDELQASGLSVVGLAVDGNAREGMTPEWLEMGARYPMVAAPRAALARLTTVRSVPARLLFDRKGQLRKQYPGDVAIEVLRADVADLMKE